MASMTLIVSIPGPFFEGGIIKDAFHGTNEAAARLIFRDGFSVSENPRNRYASGIYFWEGDYLAGFWWARDKRSGPGVGGKPVVVQAEVELGRTFLVNSIGDQLEGIRQRLSEWHGRTWELEDVVRLICRQLRETGAIDAIRAVTRARASKNFEDPWYRAEVVLAVFDRKRAKPTRLYSEEQMRQDGAELELNT